MLEEIKFIMLLVVVFVSVVLFNFNIWKKDKLKCYYIYNLIIGGGRRGFLGIEKLYKKLSKIVKS